MAWIGSNRSGLRGSARKYSSFSPTSGRILIERHISEIWARPDRADGTTFASLIRARTNQGRRARSAVDPREQSNPTIRALFSHGSDYVAATIIRRIHRAVKSTVTRAPRSLRLSLRAVGRYPARGRWPDRTSWNELRNSSHPVDSGGSNAKEGRVFAYQSNA